jgi:phage terminase large subunit-like protein
MSCISCSSCGYPHLDLADFADTPHRKHFCGNCGRDSTWSKVPIISTPLKPLHDSFARTLKYETPDRTLNLDDYAGFDFAVWASTPAIVWTAERPQEFGIHVHVQNAEGRIVDDTFGEVIYQGTALERPKLIADMMARTVV